MADQQSTGGGRHRRPETDDGQAMTATNFHSVTVTGDNDGDMVVEIELCDGAGAL